MIIDHQYQTSYAGVDSDLQRCQHLYRDGVTCLMLPQDHQFTNAPAGAHGHSPGCSGEPCTCGMGNPKVRETHAADHLSGCPNRYDQYATRTCGTPLVDMVNHPPHYTSHASGVECIEIARHLSGDWFNAFKYVFRADLKNGKQDIEKAAFYSTDALAHGIPMRGFGWGAEQDEKLRQIIDAEPDDGRRRFYTAVSKCWRHEADQAVADILARYV